MIAIVILLRVLARMSCIIERSSVEGFTSFNGNKRSNFCGEKEVYNEASWGVYFSRIGKKN